MESHVLWVVLALAGSFGGAWFGAYLKKKGENYATHEDLGKLVEQVEAVTAATKQIEAKISDEVWNRQRRWELKRDVILDGARRLGVCLEAFLALWSAYEADKLEIRMGRPGNINERVKRAEAWSEASKEFSASRFLLVSMVCEEEFRVLLSEAGRITRTIGIELTGGNPDAAMQHAQEFRDIFNAVGQGFRKELERGV